MRGGQAARRCRRAISGRAPLRRRGVEQLPRGQRPIAGVYPGHRQDGSTDGGQDEVRAGRRQLPDLRPRACPRVPRLRRVEDSGVVQTPRHEHRAVWQHGGAMVPASHMHAAGRRAQPRPGVVDISAGLDRRRARRRPVRVQVNLPLTPGDEDPPVGQQRRRVIIPSGQRGRGGCGASGVAVVRIGLGSAAGCGVPRFASGAAPLATRRIVQLGSRTRIGGYALGVAADDEDPSAPTGRW